MRLRLIVALPFLIAFIISISPLAFVPVPWPDDSAFYLPIQQLFAWPPRWVMINQAPFEPSYRDFNFNIMPLFSILLGLGRWIGIDGSHLLKFWPLMGWALSGGLLALLLTRRGLSPLWVAGIILGFSLDPELRWASVLVRPESWVGLLGLLAFGFALDFIPTRFQPTRLWDPVAACLALAAYMHYNAIHLVLPVAVALAPRPKRLFRVGALTALYLLPWILIVLVRLDLFTRQMSLQWTRLSRSPWLHSPKQALEGIYQSMGSPNPWPDEIYVAAAGLWLLILAAGFFVIALPWFRKKNGQRLGVDDWAVLSSAAWVGSAMFLWHRKPEVWFVYHIHAALWVFCGFLAVWLCRLRNQLPRRVLGGLIVSVVLLFLEIDVRQWVELRQDPTWTWNSYEQLVDCIDEQLAPLAQRKENLEVWCPTFPDITIELARRHPHWDLTRHNDFNSRSREALAHGEKVDAVVVTDVSGQKGRAFSELASAHPELRSEWVTKMDPVLNQLDARPDWMPRRTICNLHRWQAFIYTK